MTQEALHFLLASQNPDGGWGAYGAQQSNTETTAIAVMALGSVPSPTVARSVEHGLHWLTTRQNPDGSWPLTPVIKEGSWATSLAILTLSFYADHRERAIRGAKWLLRQKGQTLGWLQSLLYRLEPQKTSVVLNPDLQGWAWTSGTFSWVEPTAYALLALKTLKPYFDPTQARERIQQGELLIYDRMCEGGGWNYGNSRVLGESLWPYPDTTALALIALQDHQSDKPNQLSLGALRQMLPEAASGLALSWAIICFRLYSEDVTQWRELLTKSYTKTGFLSDPKIYALALLASQDGPQVFKLPHTSDA